MKSANTKKGFSLGTWVAIILSVLLLIGTIWLAIDTYHNFSKPADVIDDTSAGLVFDEAAVEGGWEQLSQEEIEDRLNNQLEEGMINISMNTSPYFDNVIKLI